MCIYIRECECLSACPLQARELKAQAKHQAEMHKQKFELHYTRYSNHLQNGELERQLLKHSQEKTKHLAAMAAVAEKRGIKLHTTEASLYHVHFS